jgi:hypothetical protein
MANQSSLNPLIENVYGDFVMQKVFKMALFKDKLLLSKVILKDIDNIRDPKLMVKWKDIIKSNFEVYGCNIRVNYESLGYFCNKQVN